LIPAKRKLQKILDYVQTLGRIIESNNYLMSGGVIDSKKRKAWSAKGGRTRAKSMTPEQRSESARQAVKARWAKAKKAGA
jgi:hypothetical protein